jgi:hypothetical protein
MQVLCLKLMYTLNNCLLKLLKFDQYNYHSKTEQVYYRVYVLDNQTEFFFWSTET